MKKAPFGAFFIISALFTGLSPLPRISFIRQPISYVFFQIFPLIHLVYLRRY